MFFLSDMLNKKTRLPKPGEALPGRSQPIPTASQHFISKRPLKGPYPEGMEMAVFGLGCFWGAERLFWQLDGVWVTAAGYAGGLTPNPTYQETCTGLTGHAEVVLVVFDPEIVSYAGLLKVFWEAHDPTQGMRQGNDLGTTLPLGHLHVRTGSARGRDRLARRLCTGVEEGGPRQHHHRDRAGAGILFRRGRPPAVSGEEPLRILRPAGHRHRLRGARRRPGDQLKAARRRSGLPCPGHPKFSVNFARCRAMFSRNGGRLESSAMPGGALGRTRRGIETRNEPTGCGSHETYRLRPAGRHRLLLPGHGAGFATGAAL